MTGLKFTYKIDKHCRTITLSILGGVVLVGGLLWWLSPGEYLPVWFASIAFAVMLLVALSIPRNIRITPGAVEIRCLVEITHISYNHIRSVRRVERAEFRHFVPVFASPGFFGYFGYWLDLQNWDFVKVYATSWQGLVLIEDIYEQRYLVGANDPDRLCEEIDLKIKKLVI
jgi:hypothetical protein